MANPLISKPGRTESQDRPDIEATPPKIGLALGGGVVRGIAHIGVLSVLRRAGIPIDLVAGSSVGSLIGLFYCSGLNETQGLDLARQMNWFKLAQLTWPIRGFLSFEKLERWLVEILGDIQFEDLKTPFWVMTTDLDNGKKFVFHSGSATSAVRASCSVPGIISPYPYEGRWLGDGSLVDSVPVAPLREAGADYVIGVDILAPRIRDWWGAFGYGLDALEILVRQAGGGFQSADYLISPNLAGMTYLRFSHVERIFERGVEAAQAALPEIIVDLRAHGITIYSEVEPAKN